MENFGELVYFVANLMGRDWLYCERSDGENNGG